MGVSFQLSLANPWRVNFRELNTVGELSVMICSAFPVGFCLTFPVTLFLICLTFPVGPLVAALMVPFHCFAHQCAHVAVESLAFNSRVFLNVIVQARREEFEDRGMVVCQA